MTMDPDGGGPLMEDMWRLREQVVVMTASFDEVRRLIRRGRDGGLSWFKIAFAAGLPETSVKRVLHHRPPSRQPAKVPPLVEAIPAREPFEFETTVSEAATRLGIARPTVHQQARRGLLNARTDVTNPKKPTLKIETNELGTPVQRTVPRAV